MAVLQRFADPEVERAFLRTERRERGQAIRALLLIAVATLISYLILNPLHFPREGVIAYSAAAGVLIILMLGFLMLTRTEIYLDRPWLDVPVFIAMTGGMKALAIVLAGQSAVTGFPSQPMALIQMGILIVFASIGFAGTFRLFLPWAFVVLAVFAAWLWSTDVPAITKTYTLSNFSTFFVFGLYFNWDLERRARSAFAANLALVAEREKTEALLHNVLPRAVADRLREGEQVADAFSDLTVVFVDLVGFSALAKRLSPGHLVRLLNAFFSAADRCADEHGLEKVKTIGDAYLAVAGGMGSRGADSRAALAFARNLVSQLEAIGDEHGLPLAARIGIHTGPVVGGVIGSSRLAYDYWGDTMNVASRLQGAAPPNGVAASEPTYHQLRGHLAFEAVNLSLKGIGDTPVYIAALGRDADRGER
jgi:class 3 adenylate cyclase